MVIIYVLSTRILTPASCDVDTKLILKNVVQTVAQVSDNFVSRVQLSPFIFETKRQQRS